LVSWNSQQRKTTYNGCLTSTFNFGYLWEDYHPSYTVDKVGIPNRKNIAKALDTYNAYSPQVKKNLHSYIQTLGLPMDANGKYTITDEESLKNFVYAI